MSVIKYCAAAFMGATLLVGSAAAMTKNNSSPINSLIPSDKDRVSVYDVHKVRSGNTGVQKYIMNNREQFEMNVEFDWRICAPAVYANNFQGGHDADFIEPALRILVREAIRRALYESQIDNVGDIGSESAYVVIRSGVDKKASAVGVCLAEDQPGKYKALRFLERK